MHANVMKPAGFKKAGGTFKRAHPTHTELFNIQSSGWNGPWGRSFYVNCGLAFEGLPMEHPWQHFAGTQWADRIESVVNGAPSSREYTDDNVDQVLEAVAQDILQASAILAAGLDHYRQKYLERVQRIHEFNARAKL
jgi:hypothetical protein